VKFYLDVGWGVSALSIVIVPALLGGVLPRLDDTGKLPPDLPVLVSFHLQEPDTASEPVSLDDHPLLYSGRGELRIRTRNRGLWVQSLLFFEAVVLALFYGLTQMRALVRNLLADQPFHPENAQRIRRVGWTVVGWSLLRPTLQYAIAALHRADLQIDGLAVSPAFDFEPDLLVVGLAVVALAEVFHHAARMAHEQSLTI
jgi:hypothetical protein